MHTSTLPSPGCVHTCTRPHCLPLGVHIHHTSTLPSPGCAHTCTRPHCLPLGVYIHVHVHTAFPWVCTYMHTSTLPSPGWHMSTFPWMSYIAPAIISVQIKAVNQSPREIQHKTSQTGGGVLSLYKSVISQHACTLWPTLTQTTTDLLL